MKKKNELPIVEVPSHMPGARKFIMGNCMILLSREMGVLHLSISHKNRYPTWEEIKRVRYELMPKDITVAQILPPEENFVNLHSNCFHLWEITEDELNVKKG